MRFQKIFRPTQLLIILWLATSLLAVAQTKTASPEEVGCKNLLEKGRIALLQVNLSEAQTNFLGALKIAQQLKNVDLEIETRFQLVKLYQDRNTFEDALDQLDAIAAIVGQSGEKTDSVRFGLLLTEKADALNALEKSKEAFENVQKAYQINLAKPERTLQLAIAVSLGNIYLAQSANVRAQIWFEKAQALSESSPNPNHIQQGRIYLRLSYLHDLQGDYDQTFAYLEKAQREYAYPETAPYLWRIWRAYADFYNARGENKKAIENYSQLCKWSEQHEVWRRATFCYQDLGFTYLWNNELTEARETFLKARASVSRGQIKDFQPNLELGWAWMLGRENRLSESRRVFAELEESSQVKQNWALQLRLKLARAHVSLAAFPAESLTDIESAINLSQANQNFDVLSLLYLLRGKTLLRLGKDAEAEQSFLASVKSLEEARSKVDGANASINFFGDENEAYYQLINEQLGQRKYRSALIFSDLLKSRWLTDQYLKQAPPLSPIGAQPGAQSAPNELVMLSDQIIKSTEAVLKGDSSAPSQLQKLETAYGEKKAALSQKPNKQFSFAAAELSEQDLSALKADSQLVVISYHVAPDGSIYLFLLEPSKEVAVFKLAAGEKTVKSEIENFRSQIEQINPAFKTTARRLYQELLGPAATIISKYRGVIIIPQGILWELPFQALVTANDKYLIEELEVTYSPSLKTASILLNAHKDLQPLEIASFGNPQIPTQINLPGAEQEASVIAALYPKNSLFLGRDATEGHFREMIGQAKIIHIAAHGSTENNLFDSAIFLAKDNKYDGKITINKILELNFRSQLIVLSACDTNRGEIAREEGLLSLSWAFLAAGAGNIVGSRWLADDRQTSKLMISFHQRLKSGDSIGLALQKAQTQALKQQFPYNHPYYWAGFSLIGNYR